MNLNDHTRNSLAIASMITGIISIVLFFIPIWGIVNAIVGLILSIIGLKSLKRYFAITGLVTAIVGLVISGLFNFCYITACAYGMLSMSNDYSYKKVSPYCDDAYYCEDCDGDYCTCYYFDDDYDLNSITCPDSNRI